LTTITTGRSESSREKIDERKKKETAPGQTIRNLTCAGGVRDYLILLLLEGGCEKLSNPYQEGEKNQKKRFEKATFKSHNLSGRGGGGGQKVGKNA